MYLLIVLHTVYYCPRSSTSGWRSCRRLWRKAPGSGWARGQLGRIKLKGEHLTCNAYAPRMFTLTHARAHACLHASRVSTRAQAYRALPSTHTFSRVRV